MSEEEIIQDLWMAQDDWEKFYPNKLYPHEKMKHVLHLPKDEYDKCIKERIDYTERIRKMKPLSFEKKQELNVAGLVESIKVLLKSLSEKDVKRMYNVLIDNETDSVRQENLSKAVDVVFHQQNKVKLSKF